MVRGLDVFKEFFRDFQNQYVLIGGAACDIIFTKSDLMFRATKDLDMVLIIESLTPQFYRFDKPKVPDFPYMIELFAKLDSVFDNDSYDCRPLYLGNEISSLSAILLNNDYYELLLY